MPIYNDIERNDIERKDYMNIGIYFNPEETKWIKEQPEGTVRELVQNAMGIHRTTKGGSQGDGLNKTGYGSIPTCKVCGYLLPYYKGKCKNGCKTGYGSIPK